MRDFFFASSGNWSWTKPLVENQNKSFPNQLFSLRHNKTEPIVESQTNGFYFVKIFVWRWDIFATDLGEQFFFAWNRRAFKILLAKTFFREKIDAINDTAKKAMAKKCKGKFYGEKKSSKKNSRVSHDLTIYFPTITATELYKAQLSSTEKSSTHLYCYNGWPTQIDFSHIAYWCHIKRQTLSFSRVRKILLRLRRRDQAQSFWILVDSLPGLEEPP